MRRVDHLDAVADQLRKAIRWDPDGVPGRGG